MPASPASVTDSILLLSIRISDYVSEGYLGPNLVTELLPQGKALSTERELWDYKVEFPRNLPVKPNPTQKKQRDLAMASLMKDVAAFYNTHGGYILVGIDDASRQIQGWSHAFDCDEFNRRLQAATRHSIQCSYQAIPYELPDGEQIVGILHIPRRHDDLEPAQFLRDAPENTNGYRAYRRQDIYFRQGDECKPAKLAEDLAFICSPLRRQVAEVTERSSKGILDNNLGPRDAGLIRFVGRESDLQKLWRWLCDEYRPALLLSGLGGVGKTTIAREFCEHLVRYRPLGLERLVWLSAKEEFYRPILDEFRPTTRVDFSDTRSLMKALLREIGVLDNEIDEDISRIELLDRLVSTLEIFPSFIVIDDLDSLPLEEQTDAFQTMLQVASQTTNKAVPSRCVMTARLQLGAAPGQLLRIDGLNSEDFFSYVRMTAESMGLPKTCLKGKKLRRKFHRITEGSPLFASSVLRLVQLGEPLDRALNKWADSSGEDIRKFAFDKELQCLSDAQVRTLYAGVLLGDTSFIELQHVTERGERSLKDDLGVLIKYHMITSGTNIPVGGARLTIPSGIRLMKDVIVKRLLDPKRIERACVKVRSRTTDKSLDIGRIIHRVVALWREERFDDALDLTRWAVKKHGRNGDLKCLLGRSYLNLPKPNYRRADASFRQAYKFGCGRSELLDLWLDAKESLKDWQGIVEIIDHFDQNRLEADHIFKKARALRKLGEGALTVGRLEVASDHFHRGGKFVDDAFTSGLATGRVYDLRQERHEAFRSYVKTVAKLRVEPDEHIEVWLAVLESFEAYVRPSRLVRFGVERLRSWWSAVEQRPSLDFRASALLDVQLTRLEEMVAALQQLEYLDEELIEYLLATRDELEGRRADLFGDSECTS